MEPVECPPTPLHLPPDGGESPKNVNAGSPSHFRKRHHSASATSTGGASSSPNASPRAGSSGEGPSSSSEAKKEGRETSESPEPNCAICLGKLENKSFTDSCFHQFCFTCLLEWSKVKAECPLCKQTFKSIIHSVRSIEDYDQYHLRQAPVPQDVLPQPWLPYGSGNYSVHLRNLMTMRDPYYASQRIPNRRRTRSTYWTRSATSTFREMVYSDGLWVRPMADITGRYRECTSQFYVANPACTHRLMPWLNRELNAMVGFRGASHVMYLMDLMSDWVRQYDIVSREFRERISPYLGINTDHFLHEFWCFARAPYDMSGYDQYAQYEARPEPVVQELDSSNDSDSSDIQVVSPEPQRPRDEPLDLAMPGPSGISRPVAVTVKQESDSDDCQIVACLKPIGERTPEIVTLSSETSDEEVVPPPRMIKRKRRIMWDSESSSGAEAAHARHHRRPPTPNSDSSDDEWEDDQKNKTHTVSVVNVEQTRIRISSVVTRPAASTATFSTSANTDSERSDSSGGHRKHHKKHKKEKRKDKGKGKGHKCSGKGKKSKK